MLSYTTILIASLIAVLVAGLIYKAAALFNKGISDSDKPGYHSNEQLVVAGGIMDRHSDGIAHRASMGKKGASGQTSQATAWSLAQMYPVLPTANDKQTSIWPHAVETLGFNGKASKVSRNVSPKVLKLEQVCKPFKRKVDSGTPSLGTASKPADCKPASEVPGPKITNTPVTGKVAPRVNRKVAQRPLSTHSEGKPWGW